MKEISLREPREILFEGFSEDELLGLPPETIEGLVLIGEPIVFRVGSATLLGSFRTRNKLRGLPGETLRQVARSLRGRMDRPRRLMRKAEPETPPRARIEGF